MKAISLIPGTTHVSLVERSEPKITAPDEVKIKIEQVGICGTDREEAKGGRADAPEGKRELIIGHEMFGRVVETGPAVTRAVPGDYAVFTVRRGCGKCRACRNGRSDMCYTGGYTERGIKGADGYQAEYVVDKEEYLVKVPAEIRNIGVLTEPMSVAAKAIDESLTIQAARLGYFDDPQSWLKGKRALIAGIGAIGLLAAFALRAKGAEVFGLDIVDEDTLRPQILKQIGGIYLDDKIKVTEIDKQLGQIDFIFEATGIARLQMQLIDALGINGIYVATGIPSGERPLTVPAGTLMEQLVLKNQIVLGSVNASIRHYEHAVHYLQEARKKWPEAIGRFITDRIAPENASGTLHSHSENEIKTVIQWDGRS